MRVNMSIKIVVATGIVMTAIMSPAPATVTPQPAVDCSVELDQSVRPAYEHQKAIIKVGLNGKSFSNAAVRPPVNLSIALDRSRSMTEDKLAKVKDAAIAAVRKLGPNDIFSLVVYAQNVETVIQAQNVRDVEAISARIKSIGPTKGNTSLFGGISLAAHEIRRNPGKEFIRRIILMSDGKANAGPSGEDDMGRLAHALKKEGISVTTVGVGNDYNEDLMTVLAAKSDGNTYYVKVTDDLPRIFTAELGDVLSVIAKNVMVSITCPEGVKPVSIINMDGKIQGNNITLGMNQVYGGQQKYALVEVEIPQSQATGTMQLANATVTYDNALTHEAENANAHADVTFSQKQQEVAQSLNKPVQNTYYINSAATAQDNAIELVDEGKLLQAAEELRRNSRMLRWNGTMNNDTQLIQTADEMDIQAEQVGQKGIPSEQRKSWRAKGYQIRQQQLAQ